MGMHNKLTSDTRCERCDWEHGHIFHICFDKNDPAHTKVHDLPPKKRRNVPKDAEWRAAISEGQKRRYDKARAKHQKRDQMIVARYEEGDVGIKKVAEEFGIAYQTCRNILQYHNVVRPKGLTISRPGK